MSAMQASVSRERKSEPTTLAAGPERMVSTGYSRASAESMSEPSPLTTISGERMPRSASMARTEPIRSPRRGIRRAFRAVVRARREACRLLVSSWPQVTGRPQCSRTRRRTAFSCAGLRTEK